MHRPDSKDFASGLSQARHDNGDKKARMDARTDVQVRASRQHWWSIFFKILLILALARFFFGVGWLVIIIFFCHYCILSLDDRLSSTAPNAA